MRPLARRMGVAAGLLAACVAASAITMSGAYAAGLSTPSETAPSSASSSASGVVLSVTPAKAVYGPKEPITLRVRVANQSGAACGLLDSAHAALTVLAATRDGQPLAPSFSSSLPINGATPLIQPYVRQVPSGSALNFTLAFDASQGIPATTVDPDGIELVAGWPAATPGSYYTLTLAYQVPPLAGAEACPDLSNQVTVSYSVTATSAQAHGGISIWWWLGAIGIMVVLVVALLVLLRRRTRRRATAVAAILCLFASAAAVLIRPSAAHASIIIDSGKNSAITDQYADCIGKINAVDPSLVAALTGPNSPTVIIVPDVQSAREDLVGGTPRDSFIRWAYKDKSHILGENGEVNYDPCAELDHELNHARDAANGNLHNYDCDSTGILYDEVSATLAENQYRAKYHLPQRTTYDYKPLPPSMASCTPPKNPPRRPINRTRHCNAQACGTTSGDPHLTTFDGLRYDFQAVGEFTATQSTAGDMTVQVRQQPYLSSKTVATNTAIAVQAGPNRLGFYLNDGMIAVHRDGTVTSLPDGSTPLSGGVVIERNWDSYTGDEYDILWPDGSVASVWRTASVGLALAMHPAQARANTLTGLLGTFNGDITDDMTVRGGAKLAFPPPFDLEYPGYADSWRVTTATSLFDYAPGQTTETFTDATFPVRAATVPGDRSDAARAACAAAGVTGGDDLAACILDVALTGQAAFAVTADDVQSVISPASGSAAASPVIGTITKPGGTVKFTYHGLKGQRLYVHVVSTTLPDACGVLTLLAPDRRAIGGGCIGGPSSIDASKTLPATGTYTLVVGPDGTSTGSVAVEFIATTDQSTTGAVDGPPTTLAVPAAGGQTRVTFTGTLGQRIFVTATAPTLPRECGTLHLVAPDGSFLANGCFDETGGAIDSVVLPSTGTYAVLLDPVEADSGQITIRVTSAADQTQQASIGGPPVTMTIGQPGAVSRLTFTGTRGQRVTVQATGSTLPNACGTFTLRAMPGNDSLGSACVFGTGTLGPITLPATGQYALVLDPILADTGHLTAIITAG